MGEMVEVEGGEFYIGSPLETLDWLDTEK